jgi:hypothetical protein
MENIQNVYKYSQKQWESKVSITKQANLFTFIRINIYK